MRKLRPVYLATLVLVISYCVTTGLGAAIFTLQTGREQLAANRYPHSVAFDWMTTLGSPLYWSLLLSLIIIAPATAFASERVARPVVSLLRVPDIPVWIPLAIAAGMCTFCIYKLTIAGALSARDAWDQSVCHEDKILRRIELINLLGTRFYCFAYSSLPMLGCYLLAQAIKKRNCVALISCLALSALIVWIDIAMIMKAPAIIYIGSIGLTLWLCGVGVLRSAGVAGPAAIAVYAALSIMQFCHQEVAPWNRGMPTSQVSPASVEIPTPVKITAAPKKTAVAKAGYMVRAALLRMAAGFPYYVQMFSDPEQRCGIELPPLRWLPKQACFPPIKVFHQMYPEITNFTGFQPSPINVSAYAEAGPWYAVVATIACGLIIGVVSAFGGSSNPLSITITVACCIYAYYASQVSLIGSLIDSYGLVWLLFPLAAMAPTSLLPEFDQWLRSVKRILARSDN